MLRICPEMWDYPVCFPTDRANLIHGKGMYVISPPVHWGYFIYLPRIELGLIRQIDFKIYFLILEKSENNYL